MIDDANPEEGFNPKDIEEMNIRFGRLAKDSTTGYAVELYISRANAREMVATWLEAVMGNPSAVSASFDNYSYIVEEIMHALAQDDDKD